jgi:DNA-binding transcriptional ArsR family regulator
LREFMNVVKALAEENRVRILCLLREQDLCVCQIIEVLELAPSTVSKHLSILHQARLIDSEKRGRWVYYSLACGDVPSEVCAACKWIFDSIADDPKIKADTKNLKQVMKLDPEELCKVQAGR